VQSNNALSVTEVNCILIIISVAAWTDYSPAGSESPFAV